MKYIKIGIGCCASRTVAEHLLAGGRTMLVEDEERARTDDALPAGHPYTWGLLTAGTVLEGAPWPG